MNRKLENYRLRAQLSMLYGMFMGSFAKVHIDKFVMILKILS